MADETRDGRADSAPLLLAGDLPAGDSEEGILASVGFWASGGAGILLWTALAFWLTA
jgi:hypothetical protein